MSCKCHSTQSSGYMWDNTNCEWQWILYTNIYVLIVFSFNIYTALVCVLVINKSEWFLIIFCLCLTKVHCKQLLFIYILFSSWLPHVTVSGSSFTSVQAKQRKTHLEWLAEEEGVFSLFVHTGFHVVTYLLSPYTTSWLCSPFAMRCDPSHTYMSYTLVSLVQ